MKRTGGRDRDVKSRKTQKEDEAAPDDTFDPLSKIVVTSTYHIDTDNFPSTSQSVSRQQNSKGNLGKSEDSLTCLLCSEPFARDTSLIAARMKRRKNTVWSSSRKSKKKKEPPGIPDRTGPATVFTKALMSFEAITKIKMRNEDASERDQNWIQFFSVPEKRSNNPVDNLPWASDHPCCDNCYRKLARFDNLTGHAIPEEAVRNKEVEQIWLEILNSIQLKTPHAIVSPDWRSLQSSLLKFTENFKTTDGLINPTTDTPSVIQHPEEPNSDFSIETNEEEMEVQYWFENVKSEHSVDYPCFVCRQIVSPSHHGTHTENFKSTENYIKNSILQQAQEEGENVLVETYFSLCENCNDLLLEVFKGNERVDEMCKEVNKLEQKLQQKLKEFEETAKSVQLATTEAAELLTKNQNSSQNNARLKKGIDKELEKINRDLRLVKRKQDNIEQLNSAIQLPEVPALSLCTANASSLKNRELAAENVIENCHNARNNSAPPLENILNLFPAIRVDKENTKKNNVEDEETDPTCEWMSKAVGLLQKQIGKSLYQRLVNFPEMPKLSPNQFHELVTHYQKSDQLLVFKSLQIQQKKLEDKDDPDFFEVQYKPPWIHLAMQNIKIELETLDIFSAAGLNIFNSLDHLKRNVLFFAVQGNQDNLFIKNLLVRGACLMQVDSKGQNLLHYAAQFTCSKKTLRYLLDLGLDDVVNAKDLDNETPIHKLGSLKNSKRKLQLLKEFVEAGASLEENFPDTGGTGLHAFFRRATELQPGVFHDLVEFLAVKESLLLFNVQDNFGRTPFLLALLCCEIQEETLEILFSSQIDFKTIDTNGVGSLAYAIKGKRSARLLQSLINKGADLNGLTKRGNNLLHFAAMHNAPLEIFELLLEEPSLDLKSVNSDGETPLFLAMLDNTDESVVTKLFITSFNAGLFQLHQRNFSFPILVGAVLYGTASVVEYILQNGNHINISTNGLDILFLQTIRNWKEPVEKAMLLIKHGADIMATNSDGQGAIHQATKWGKIETLQYCLQELRLDPNVKDKEGRTPLVTVMHDSFTEFETQYAIRMEKGKLLVQYGADAKIKWNPQSPYQYSYNDQEIFRIEKKEQTLLHLGLSCYKEPGSVVLLDFLKFLIENGAEVNELDSNGKTPLHQVMTDHPRITSELAQFLIANGADINAKTEQGETALHIATKGGNIEAIKFCLGKGLSVNEMDNEGHTPLASSISLRFLLGCDDMSFVVSAAKTQLERFKLVSEAGPSVDTKSSVLKKLEEEERAHKETMANYVRESNPENFGVEFINQLKGFLK